jgi:hypothetical protein
MLDEIERRKVEMPDNIQKLLKSRYRFTVFTDSEIESVTQFFQELPDNEYMISYVANITSDYLEFKLSLQNFHSKNTIQT